MSVSKCWSCGADRAASDALCPACGKVQPPAPAGTALDKFALLGLPQSFDLDAAQVDEKFRALSRKLHPDRFARASAQERRFSLEQTTRLNDAARVLKDPVRRAEHLLALRGVKIAGDRELKMPPEFLEQALEDREKLMEAKLEGGPEAVARLAEGVREKRDQTLEEVRALVASGDLGQAGEVLARMRYYARYLDEVEGRSAEP
jgi:molecular chaperone HscB